MKILIKTLCVALILSSCTKDSEPVSPSNLTTKLDFNKIEAIGGATTAGFMNGGLYRDGQLASFPNLIAQQAGATNFSQPLFPTDQASGTGFLIANGSATASTKISEKTAIRSTTPLLFTKYVGNINNCGIADLRMVEVAQNGLGNASKAFVNPYFERILPNGKEDETYLNFVKGNSPSFFLMYLGEHDLLSFITSGGKASMTDVASFTLNCQKLLDAFSGTAGAIANLPNPIDFPYLNTVSPQSLAQSLNLKEGLYITTANGIIRLATTDDFILLDRIQKIVTTKTDFQLGTKQNPISSNDVLDKDEVGFVADKLTNYNAILKAEADKRNIPLVDLNTVFKQIKEKKYDSGSVQVDNNILTGGFFSLDGLYPTPRGQAIIANEFIKTINTFYKSTLKTLDISKYEGLKTK